MGTFLQRTHFWGSLGQQQPIDEMKKYSKTRSLHLTLFFLFLFKNLDQTNKSFSRKIDKLLKEECAIFRGSRAMAGIAGPVS